METGDQTVKDNIPKALSGLSADPVNCVKIEILGFIPVSDIFLESFQNINCKLNGSIVAFYSL